MTARLEAELALLRRRYGAIEVGANGDWVKIPGWKLPAGWSVAATTLLILLPTGYPTVCPDNFYVGDEVRLTGGGEPGNSSANQQLLGTVWRMFSWHLDDAWAPHPDPAKGDNLVTFCLKVEGRLAELN